MESEICALQIICHKIPSFFVILELEDVNPSADNSEYAIHSLAKGEHDHRVPSAYPSIVTTHCLAYSPRISR